LQPSSVLHKPQTLEPYLHAHINIKHANKMQNSKEKEKSTWNEVEIKPSNFYIYGYELCQKLAYIKDETEMHDQLPTTRSFSCHCTFTQSCNRNNENFHLKLLAKTVKVLIINCIFTLLFA